MSSLIKSLEDTMRNDEGLNGDAQYIEQITWLLFLKAFDAKEQEWELNAQMNGKPYTHVIPEGYRWRDWADDSEGITGESLMDFVNELFKVLRNLDLSDGNTKKYVVRNVFEDINNYMKSGIYLRKLINRINEKVDFVDATKKHTFNELYEGMLKDLQSAGRAGEFYTPRPVTNFVVEKVNPKLGEKVLDPACGTGGFLTSTISHFGKVTSIEQLELLQNTIFGWEKKPLPHLLAMTNLILHDIEVPKIKHVNSLGRPLTSYSPSEKVDVIVANPPFGGNEDLTIKENFPKKYQTSETADLFLVLMMNLLKEHGRCGIVLPNGFLQGTELNDKVKFTIKNELLEEYGLHTIIRLPQVFKPYADVFTNLLFFEKGKKSDGVWFYRLDMPEGYINFTKKKPMEDHHFNPVREWWNNRTTIVDEDGNYKSKFYTIDELKSLGLDFDKCCPFPEKEEILLEPKDFINEFSLAKNKIDLEIKEIFSVLQSSIEGQEITESLNYSAITDLSNLCTKLQERMKMSVVNYALKGKLVKQLADDEDAHALLDRIVDFRNRMLKESKIVENTRNKPQPIVDEDLPFDIPSTWAWARLGTVIYFKAGKTPQRQELNNWNKKEIPWISISDMVSDGITNETKEFITKYAFDNTFGGEIVKKGTMIMSFKLTIGKMSYLGIDAVHNEAIISIYPNIDGEEKKVLSDYLFMILPLLVNYGDFTNAVKGKTLNSTSLSNLYVPLPPIGEQKRIVAKVKELFAVIDNLK